ncbi:hypothetical protein RUND412_009062 [Rhizina undulata]
MRFNFVTALLFATALALAASAPAPAADATAIATTDNYDDQDFGLEARDGILSELGISKTSLRLPINYMTEIITREAVKKQKNKPKTPATKKKVGKKPAKTTAAAACKLKSTTKKGGRKGKVSARATNDGCESARNVYRIRMKNMHAKEGTSAEEQDHCGIFIGDENDQDNHGNLYHVRFMSAKEATDAGHAGVTDMYKYERKALKKGLSSFTAQPIAMQEIIGTVSDVTKFQALEADLAVVAKTYGTQTEGFSCQKWTNTAVEIITKKNLVENFKQPSDVKKSNAADNQQLPAKFL